MKKTALFTLLNLFFWTLAAQAAEDTEIAGPFTLDTRVEHTVTFQTDGTPDATITGTNPQKVLNAEDATPVRANAPLGYRFLKWTKGGADYSLDNPLTILNVTEDLTFTAEFTQQQYTLTYTAGTGGHLEGTETQFVYYGEDGSPVTAVADGLYRFVQWSDGITDNPRTDRNVTADVSVEAVFADIQTVTEPVMRYSLGRLWDMAYSRSGDFLVTAGPIGTVLWDGKSGRRLTVLDTAGYQVTAVAFSADSAYCVAAGTRLSGGVTEYGGLVWETANWQEAGAFAGHAGRINDVALSADGSLVATASEDGTAKVWTVATGAEKQSFSGHGAAVNAVAFSFDGTQVLTGGDDNTARRWAVESGAEAKFYQLHQKAIHSVGISDDDAVVMTGGEDGRVIIWEMESAITIDVISVSGLLTADLSANGNRLLTGSGTQAQLWDCSARGGRSLAWDQLLEIRAQASVLQTLTGHSTDVTLAAFGANGTMLATGAGESDLGDDNTVRLWQTGSPTVRTILEGHTQAVRSAAFSARQGEVLAVTGAHAPSDAARSWAVNTGAFTGTLTDLFGWQGPIALSPDGNQVLAAKQSLAVLRDSATGAEVQTFSGHGETVLAVAFSPDGTMAATASADDTARLWRTADGEELFSLPHGGDVLALAFSSNGSRLATGSADNAVRIWNTEDGSDIFGAMTGHGDDVVFVAYKGDDTALYSCDNSKNFRAWSTVTGNTDRQYSAPAVATDLSPNGELMVGLDGQTVKTWDTEKGDPLRSFEHHVAAVDCAKFSPDGTRLFTGGQDGFALLWESGGTAYTNRTEDKLLIVAGGGDYLGNAISDMTRSLGNRAWQAAWARGYKKENIRYLSAFTEENENVYGPATEEAILDAVENWSTDAKRLTIMLVDHGIYNSSALEWFFMADGTKFPRDLLDAVDLDSALDTAQSGMDPLQEAIVFVDMCYAGGFVQQCGQAPAGVKRMVISSTTADRLAVFEKSDGSLSFMGFFLASIQQGNTILTSFNRANHAVTSMNEPAQGPQTAWLDDDGDGVYNEGVDGAWADEIVFGNNQAAYGYSPPAIINAMENQELDGPENLRVWCELDASGADRVDVFLSNTATNYGTDPVTGFYQIPIENPDPGTNRWSATIPASEFSTGIYSILFQATREEGVGLDLYAEPVTRTVTVGDVVAALEEPTVNYPGDGAKKTSDTVTCIWNAVDGATAYDVTIWPGNQPKPDTPTATDVSTAYYQKLPGLLPATTYFWQVTARNALQSVTGPVWSFTTAGNRADMLAVHFYHAILNRHPAPNERDYWSGYFQNAVNREIDVRFVGLAMGSSFFNSPEYADRDTTDSDFIAHCYDAFWFHDATDGEIYGWTKDGEVQRGYAMSWFARSEEYVTILQMLFPGRDGKPINNFIATMYVGILDRLPTSAEIARWAALLGGPGEKRPVAIQMALELLQSDEFTRKGRTRATTNRDVAISLYQAFFGRYPAEGEIDYWAGLLDGGTKTLEEAVHDFAGSPEFENTLTGYFQTGASFWSLY